MVLAAAGAGALVGGALFSWGTTAMAVGWMVGGWLYNTLSTSNEPGIQPQDMPQFNRALRGTPIFVTFGANRVWAQIPWSKNWTPHEQSAQGKGGGSGGGGKGGAAGGASYTYAVDIMYNFGFVDQPSFIRTAWNGSDVITFETLEAWNANITDLQSFFLYRWQQRQTPKSESAFLEADEVFFAPGYSTGHVDIESWSYFGTQENGVRCQWPYTAWLGFKQLDLGASAVIPQLSLELVPMAGASLDDGDAGFLANTTINEVTPNQSILILHASNNMMMLGEDGLHYTVGEGNTDHFVMCVETGIATTLTDAMLNAFWDGFSPAPSLLSGTIGVGWGWAFGCIPNTPYFFMEGQDTSGGYTLYNLVMKIDATGTIVAHCFQLSETSTLLFGNVSNSYSAAIAPSGNALYHFSECSDTGVGSRTFALKRIDLTGNFDDPTPGSHTQFATEIDGFDANFIGDSGTVGAALRADYSQACIVFTDGTPGVISYVSQADIDDGSQSSSVTDSMTEPGLVWSEGAGFTDLSAQLDANFRSFIMKKFDNSASSNYDDDWSSPCSFQLNGTTYLVWSRPYSDKGEYQTIKIAQWVEDTISGDPELSWILSATVRAFDHVADGMTNEANRDTQYPTNVLANYCPTSGKFYSSAMYQGSAILDQYAFADLGALLLTGGADDVTPPYIIKRILTHPAFGVSVSALFGFSVTEDSIDSASYEDSVNFCEDEGIKVATTYTNQDNVLSTFDTLLALYGGMLPVIGGKIFFKVARDTDDTGRVVNNDHLLVAKAGTPPVTIHEPAIQDSYNQIQYNYIDRGLDYKNNQIEISNEVDMDINGPRCKPFPSRFVMAGSLANMLAERALWSNLYGRRLYEFKLGWKDADLMPSDVITLVDSFDAGLSAGRKVRLVRKKESKRGTYEVVGVDHIPYHLTANHAFTGTTSVYDQDSYISSIAPVTFRMYELPKEFQDQAELYVGYNQLSQVKGAQLWLSNDGTTFNLIDQQEPFITSGIFPADMPHREPGYMEEYINIYLMPTSPFAVATPTYCQTTALDDISASQRASGLGVWIVGSEAIAVEGLTLLAQNKYQVRRLFRGWGGTPISSVTSGALWHWHRNVFERAITEDQIGTILHYKVVPYNFAGQLYNIASIDARTYQIKGLYWLPRAASPVTLWVQSPVAWTRSVAALGPFLAVESGGCNVVLTWPPAAQNAGYGAGGFGTGGYGRFTADITSPTYRVNVYSANGTVVSSSVVNTGYFNYTLAQNSADFNVFGKSLIYKVTPFNGFGDGPISASRSLSLTW